MKAERQIGSYRYEKIEGLDQALLDRYLVTIFSAADLAKIILTHRSLAKNLSYNRMQLMNGQISKEQLVEDINNQLEFCYDVYNDMMNNVLPRIERIEDEIKKERGYIKINNRKDKLEYVYDKLQDVLEGHPSKKNKLICWLRTKPQLYNKLIELLQEEVKEKENLSSIESEDEVEQGQDTGVETFGKQISYLKKIVFSMEKRAKELDDENTDKLKTQIIELQQEITEHKTTIKALGKENKNKEKEIQKIQKKYEEELKKGENEKKIMRKLQKELGETGKKLGEVRKELETANTQNRSLENEIKRIESSKKLLVSRSESENEQKLQERLASLKSEYEEEITRTKESRDKAQKMNEKLYNDLKFQYTELEYENQELKRQLEEMRLVVGRNGQSSPSSSGCEKEKTDVLVDLFDTTEFEPEFI